VAPNSSGGLCGSCTCTIQTHFGSPSTSPSCRLSQDPAPGGETARERGTCDPRCRRNSHLSGASANRVGTSAYRAASAEAIKEGELSGHGAEIGPAPQPRADPKRLTASSVTSPARAEDAEGKLH